MVDRDVQKPEEGGGWLTRGVLGIGSASFLADLGHEIPTALLPSFVTSTLGAPAAALGLIEASLMHSPVSAVLPEGRWLTTQTGGVRSHSAATRPQPRSRR